MSLAEQVSDVLNHAFVWNDKEGKAFKLNSQSHNYRIWKPTTTATPDGGVLLYTKVDHIRGFAQDDHAIINMAFDSTGHLVSGNFDVQIQGHDNILQNLADVIATSPDPKSQATATILKVTGLIHNQIEKYGETGGRLLFNSVLETLLSHLATLVVDTTISKRNYLRFIDSHDKPLEGQSNRSSENISFSSLQNQELKIDIVGSSVYGWDHADNIKFHVMEDRKFKSDPVIARDLGKNSTIKLETNKNYYISNPHYTNTASAETIQFTVAFYQEA